MRRRRFKPQPVQKITPSEWKKRRFRLDIALASILVLVFYIIFSGNDTVLYQQGLIALIGAGVALIGQYIFGAAWDDKNYMNAVKSMAENSNNGYGSYDYDENINNYNNDLETQIPEGEE